MKPKVKVRVQFGPPPKAEPIPEAPRVPRVARLLALAWWIDERIRAGEIEDLAAAARQLGLTRARVTQIANLTLLAPAIQDAILATHVVAHGRDLVTDRMLRPLVADPVWERQTAMWTQVTRRTAA